MAQRKTLKCYVCGETFRREEMTSYASPGRKVSHYYCKKCYAEKLEKDDLMQEVGRIFGEGINWPRFWKDRNRLHDDYGYTDSTIADCLRYLYEVEGVKKVSKSLTLVNPVNVEKMMKYKRSGEWRKNMFEEAAKKQYKYEYIDVRENEDDEDEDYKMDDLVRMKPY